MDKKEIGAFIKTLREKKGLTQEEFAKALKTSQSAVARMESGKQNFTTEVLERISDVLGHNIISVNRSMDFEVEGGHKLSGSIKTNYSKNGSVALLIASLLNKGTTTLHGIAKIEEVYRIIEILESIGVKVDWVDENSVKIKPPKNFTLSKLNKQSASRTRTMVLLMGTLSHYLKEFSLPHSSGCSLGKRTIAAHIYGLEDLGLCIETTHNTYKITQCSKKKEEIIMYEAGDTAVEKRLLRAAKIPERTIIKFASSNYMVQEMCFFLQKLGIDIDGIGSSTLEVFGKEDINEDIEYWNSEDPIEAMMFISAAIVTDSKLTITRVPIDFLELELYKLKMMGLKYKIDKKYKAQNGHTNLCDITVYPSKLTALHDKIHALPYPGINMDNLPFFVPIAVKAEGETMIHDWVYENRAIYFTELNRLGADVTLADPHRVFINGGKKLKSAQVVSPPALRPAMIVLIAMLGAEGTSILRNVYMINRGYEEIANRLGSIGAKIRVLQ